MGGPGGRQSLWQGALAAVIGGLALTAGGWFVSHAWAGTIGVAIVWFIVVSTGIILLRRRVLYFVSPMSSEAARARILSADREIWSFQISGGEFTAHSVKTYKEWLNADKDRRLKIAFANPANTGLLDCIVKLGGVGRLSSDDEAREHLCQIIRTSLKNYSNLSARCANQLDVRVYDCFPPFSIHAIDPMSDRQRRSIFVEFYLPGLPARERPCVLIRANHSEFKLYAKQSLAWFEGATGASLPTSEAVPPS
jgi:hypothetical protein